MKAALLLSLAVALIPAVSIPAELEPIEAQPISTAVGIKLVPPTPLTPAQEQLRIAQRIVELAPRTSFKRATYLAGQFYRTSKKYDLDPQVMVSIAMVESRFRSGLEAHWTNRGKPTVDRGIMQINQVWVDRWKLDPDRLRDDDAYNINVAGRLLKSLKKQYGGTEANWFSRYNSGWPPARAKYNKVLAPYLHVQTAIELSAGHPDPSNPSVILYASIGT
jgi:hypothetical protein